MFFKECLCIAASQDSKIITSTRKLSWVSGTDFLSYNLFKNATYSSIWGDGADGNLPASGTGVKGSTNFNVYGNIPGGQNIQVGSYTDSVTVRLDF